MTKAMENEFLELDIPELTQRLIGAVRDAQRMAVEGDDAELYALLERVRAAADEATETRYELLQLAEAALRTAARTDLGRSELALREFLAKHPMEAEDLLSTLLTPAPFPSAHAERLNADVRKRLDGLARIGVLSRSASGYELRAAHRALARDLIEPTALRTWRLVEQCRLQMATSKLDDDGRAALLASRLGIAVPQARRFVTRLHPVAANPQVSATRRMTGASLFLGIWAGQRSGGTAIIKVSGNTNLGARADLQLRPQREDAN